MSLISFLLDYKWVIIFYGLAFILIMANKSKFEIQAKIIALYRTKFGIKFMGRLASKYREFFRLMGYIGVGVGFVGMIYIMVFLLKNAYDLILAPSAVPGIGIVLPGIKVPGSPIFLPFWYGIISIFLVVVVHEASHGVMALVHKVKVKSSGFAFFGPIPAAFVEPDERELSKQSDIVQYSIFAAGPVSNVVFGLICLFLIGFVISPIQGALVQPTGITFTEVQDGFPMSDAGITPETVIYSMDGVKLNDGNQFLEGINCVNPGQTVVFGTDKGNISVVTVEHPEHLHNKGYFGIKGIENAYDLKYESGPGRFLFGIIKWIRGLFGWLVMLNFGIGLANLLPLGPVDGGRMLQVFFAKLFPKKGNRIWVKVSYFTAAVLLFIIFFSLTKGIFSLF